MTTAVPGFASPTQAGGVPAISDAVPSSALVMPAKIG